MATVHRLYAPQRPNISPDRFRELIAPMRPRGAKDHDTVETAVAAAKWLVPATEESPVEDIDRYLAFEWAVFDWISEADLNLRKLRRTWRTLKVHDDDPAYQDVLKIHAQAETRKTRFQLDNSEKVEAAPPIAWRIKNLFPEQGVVAIVGPSGSAKTFLSSYAGLAIASGIPFFGHAAKQGHVVYVALEGQAGFPTRLKAWRAHHGIPIPDMIRFSPGPFSLLDLNDIVDFAASCPPGTTIFIDTAFLAAPGLDENSAKDMSRFIAGVQMLQRLTTGLVVLVAHTGKDEAKGLRGHSSLFAALDAVIMVSRDGDARKWKHAKAKDGKDGEEHGFRLDIVELGVDADGAPVTSCVVAPDAGAVAVFSKALSKNQELGIATLQNAAHAHGILTEQGELIGVPRRQWREEFYSKSPAEEGNAKRQAFNRACNDLVELGRVEVNNDVFRFTGPNVGANTVIAAMIAERRRGEPALHRDTGVILP